MVTENKANREPSEMTEEERKKEIDLLRARLKELSATPRSDWHREFERVLRNDARPYGEDVVIRIEEELGIDPPRVDYLILDDRKRLMRGKEIFSIFRQHNIVEYKNPLDSLSMRSISKAIGYANFYIGLAEHEGDRLRSEVTITIYRAKRPQRLFDAMVTDGTLTPTGIPGIFHVSGLTDLPFQIIIGDELKGREYANYRVLSEHADMTDVEIVVEQTQSETDTAIQENNRRLLEFVELKNPGVVRNIIGGDKKMASILMKVLKPEIDAEIAEDRKVTARTIYFKSVQDGMMPIDYAAKQIDLSTADFTDSMKKAGYTVPQEA